MQMKNKLIFFFIFLFMLNGNLNADEFNISAKEVLVDKNNEVLVGTGSVNAVDKDGNVITADKITYKKTKEFLLAEGNVKVVDVGGNILLSQRLTYDKINEIIVTKDNSELILIDGYKLSSKNIFYNIKNQTLSSSEDSTFTDTDGNNVEATMFQYDIKNNLLSSVGKIKVYDINKNKYFFKEIHINTKEKEMIGSDVSIILNQKNFGLSDQNDPRMVANDILVSDDKVILSKGVFTTCKQKNGKCPPWSLKAKKIIHDKIKKTIFYEHATLKVYDIPIFYFPKFYHPDPTVKRQSGFLAPFITSNSNTGSGLALPYYWAINNDKDITFTPKTYAKENILLLNEYRQAFENGFLTLDTSYTEGYKNTSTLKTKGSRNHIFANLDLNFNKDDSYESNIFLKLQKTSNDTYFKVHDINTALVNSDNVNLENELQYDFRKNDMYLNVVGNVYENLDIKKKSKKYEYVLPNIFLGKTFFTENFGILNLESNAYYSNYETNKHKTFLTNDIIWKSIDKISKGGFVNSLTGMVRNTNYEAEKTSDFKNEGTNNELSGVLAHKTSLPLKKDGINHLNIFSPNFILRFAPGHMRDLKKNDINLNYTNLYALNKTPEIENGLSAILGFDYKINEKNDGNINKEKLSLSLGQIFNHKENRDLPSKSSLDQKTSDIVGDFKYNFSEIGKIDYKFSLDHNLNDLNYNEIATELDFKKIQFNLGYLEQQNHIGKEHYASSGITLNVSESNKLSFSTKKNFKTESTELYNLSYQYANDCLTAGISYRREFYNDIDDTKPKDNLMFTFTFVPFASVNTPNLKK